MGDEGPLDQQGSVSRRDFLARSGVAALALGASGCAHMVRAPARILIVGGGLAGLRTLDLLRRAGRDAHLLEGSRILGGRMRTLREGLPEGVTVELGAERVPDGCVRLQALINELGLEIVDYPILPGAFSLRMDGGSHRYRRPSELPNSIRSALHAKERDTWPFFLHLAYCDASQEISKSDPRSGLEWLRDEGLSAMGERFVRAFCPEPVALMSAFEFWSSSLRMQGAGISRTLRGGVDQMTQKLAARHADHISTGVDIERFERHESGATVHDATGRKWRGQYVVFALPLEPLKRLRFEPRLPGLINAWTVGRKVASEIRIHVDFDERELARQDVNPALMGLDFPRITWPRPEVTPTGRRILSTVSFYDETDFVRRTLAEQGNDGLRKLLQSRIPEITTFGPEVWIGDLNVEPRIGGTFPYRVAGSLPAPTGVQDGPLILAGGDFSSWPGSMEGALESAETAAALILTARGPLR